jgi:hypothetical protein
MLHPEPKAKIASIGEVMDVIDQFSPLMVLRVLMHTQ